MRYIGVIDCNNFFVSCERLFRPDLSGKPVVVLSSNDGCVIARSKEIKDRGIPMGMPHFQIKDILKDVDYEVFSSHFSLYRDISRRVFSVVRDKLETVEQYSIDEAFFILESNSVSEIYERSLQLQNYVEQCVGIPVSIGLATTKTQAKYANRLAKKTATPVLLDAIWWQKSAESVLLQDVWGVGNNLAKRYREFEIITVANLLATPKSQLDSHFGIAGLRLQSELSSRVLWPVVQAQETKKSIMSSRSFGTTVSDVTTLKDAVAHHVHQVSHELRRQKLVTSRLLVILGTSQYGDYFQHGGTAEVTFVVPTADTGVLLVEAMRLVEHLFESGVLYKKAGIRCSYLVNQLEVQPTLFSFDPIKSTAAISNVIDEINQRFGCDRIQLGRQSQAVRWQVKQASVSPSYTTRWSEIAVVKA